MTDSVFGQFDSDKAYVDSAVAAIWGKSIRQTRELLRDNFEVAELGGGVLLISGRNLIMGIERMSQSPRVCDEDGNTLQAIQRREPARRPAPRSDPSPPTRRRGTPKNEA